MNSPVLDLRPSMTAKKMRACFDAYKKWAQEYAQKRLSLLDMSSAEDFAPKIKEIVEEASDRIVDAAAELAEGLRLRNELRGVGGFR